MDLGAQKTDNTHFFPLSVVKCAVYVQLTPSYHMLGPREENKNVNNKVRYSRTCH